MAWPCLLIFCTKPNVRVYPSLFTFVLLIDFKASFGVCRRGFVSSGGGETTAEILREIVLPKGGKAIGRFHELLGSFNV